MKLPFFLAPYAIATLILSCLLSTSVRAQSWFDLLVIPGPLIEGHAKYEHDCKNCHEPFSKRSQMRLCLDCHKEIAADREGKQGLHGRRPDRVNEECNHCHTEHKGRDADLVQFDRETFDHDFTDFRLNGAHRTVHCEGCHKPDVTYRKAPHLCIDCHKTDEPHKGRLGEKCEACHKEDAWHSVKPYDHSKTKFELTGAHEKVACDACHAGERYKGVSTICSVCHQLQDVHSSRYGAKCDNCHRPEKWDVITFDHDRETKFVLRGEHKQVQCDDCHKGDLYNEKLATDCFSCHEKNDPHKEQLGKKCEDCHDENGWRQKVEFDHDKTSFPLISLHSLVLCEECHPTQSFKDSPTKCLSCHEDSYHQNRFGADCSKCHSPNGWKIWQFDHDRKTKFPLTGAHKKVKCHECHRLDRNSQPVKLSTTCYFCHAKDDPHYGLFGRKCDFCHTTDKFTGVLGR